MNASDSTNTPASTAAASQDAGFSPWQRLKTKRISYLTLPLLIMATITEFVILSTGWRYQQVACLPPGMGVTFFGIGPIGATILAVELLKLPLAIWTASRQGWQKAFMICFGLPLICVLTFQLVKDMAVYEMGIAMKPASEMLEKASAEEIKIKQLNGDLAAIQVKKTNREERLAELEARKTKAKTDLEEALKRNAESRQDAISLTAYQQKELSDVQARQTSIIKQFDADTEKLTKALADLRSRRETELGRATQWNAEEARIENAYKTQLAEYTNKKNAYEKDLAEYKAAGFLKRQLMKEPVDPGVPPVRESNTVLKPTAISEIDAEIKAKETELLAVNNQRRERVAQVEDDARRLRAEFDTRSSTKREEADRKREELLAANTAVNAQLAAEEKEINQEFQTAAQKVDGIRAQIDECRKKADGLYEAREESIKTTQVHRIATTVEIVRGLIFGKRPVSITASARERGDLYTDQISMVRIWVYPVLAFIVAFLPTLMVEIGFSTVFKPEKQRPQHRLGFLGRRLHWLYTRAGRVKILHAERMAREASAKLTARDLELAAAKNDAATQFARKDAELQAARDAAAITAMQHEEQLQQRDAEWSARYAGVVDSLNQAVAENDALRDLQKAEVERQVQLRQNAWSERVAQLNQEFDDLRAANEAERTALVQEHHKKMMALSEDCKAQVTQARRQVAETELAAKEASARLSQELKEARQSREMVESRMQHQADSFAQQLSHAKEQSARELDKAVRLERQRLERQLTDLEKALRHRDEDFEHRLKQREQELSYAFDTRLAEEQSKAEEEARRRAADVERQLEARAREVDARWHQESQQQEETFQLRLKQQALQLQTEAEVRLRDMQTQAGEQLHRQESDLKRLLEAQSREAEARLREELQQQELLSHARLDQREQELASRAAEREAQLQKQYAEALRSREEEWEQQTRTQAQATATRLAHEAQQKEEEFQLKLRQLEQNLQSQHALQQAELKTRWDQELVSREQEWERKAEANARAGESRLKAEMQQREESLQATLRQRDEEWQEKLDAARAELRAEAEQELRRHEMDLFSAHSRALRETETRVRKELRDKHEAAQSDTRQREQTLTAQLTAQTEALRLAEKQRDEAVQSAARAAGQVQSLKEKLMQASSLLSGWRSGNGNGNGNGNGHHLVEVAAVGRNGF